MPWDVKKVGERYCVTKKGSDKPIKGGCHPTRSEAERHRRALYANVKEAPTVREAVQNAQAPTEAAGSQAAHVHAETRRRAALPWWGARQ